MAPAHLYTDGFRSLELSGLGVSAHLCGGSGRRRCPGDKASELLMGAEARMRRARKEKEIKERRFPPPPRGCRAAEGEEPILIRDRLDLIAADRSASPECLMLWQRARGEALREPDTTCTGKRCPSASSHKARIRRRSIIDQASIDADRVRNEQDRQRALDEFEQTIREQKKQRDKARERLLKSRCKIARDDRLRALAVGWSGNLGKRVVYPAPDSRSQPSSPQYNSSSTHGDWGAFAMREHQLDGGGVSRQLLGGAPATASRGGRRAAPSPGFPTGREFLPLGVSARTSWTTEEGVDPDRRAPHLYVSSPCRSPTGKITNNPAPLPVPSIRYVVPATDLVPKRADRLRPSDLLPQRCSSAPPRPVAS